jgi:hypothetical protein
VPGARQERLVLIWKDTSVPHLGLRAGAVLGAASLAALATAPAFAADAVAQATARSLDLTIAGQSAVSQLVTATNDGTRQSKNDASTIPTIAGVLPGNNALGVGVAPQDAGANADGTSYACAGIAGTGAGIVHTGTSSCQLDGTPVHLDLGSLTLGTTAIDPSSALGAALSQAGLGSVLDTITAQAQQNVVDQITSALNRSPLSISLGGTVSAIEADCTAGPGSATGATHLVDTQGGTPQTPITATVAGQTVTVAQLPANPPANTHVPVNLDRVSQTVIDALKVELSNAVGGALAALPLGTGLQAVQDNLVDALVAQMQPALKPLQDNVLDITLNKQARSAAGDSIHVTALDLQALPAASSFTGSSLVSGQIGDVTCGPNAGAASTAPQGSTSPLGGTSGSGGSGAASGSADPAADTGVPTAVDAGLAGDRHPDTALYAGLAGLVAAGAAGTAFVYRRHAAR